jgi:hypothetical protein
VAENAGTRAEPEHELAPSDETVHESFYSKQHINPKIPQPNVTVLTPYKILLLDLEYKLE